MQQSDLTLALSLSASPQKKAGVVAQQVLEEMVLYDGNTEMGYSLNASARTIWELCDGQRSLHAISEEIARDLQVAVELLYEDVKLTVAELASLGLLSVPEDEEKAESTLNTENKDPNK